MKKVIKVKEKELSNLLTKLEKEAYEFWSSWRLPVYVEKSGAVFSGGWLSQNSYCPENIEIAGVNGWTIDHIEDPSEEDIDFEIEKRVEFTISKLKENNQINYSDFLQIV